MSSKHISKISQHVDQILVILHLFVHRFHWVFRESTNRYQQALPLTISECIVFQFAQYSNETFHLVHLIRIWSDILHSKAFWAERSSWTTCWVQSFIAICSSFCGPTKIISFNFGTLVWENFVWRYSKPAPS